MDHSTSWTGMALAGRRPQRRAVTPGRHGVPLINAANVGLSFGRPVTTSRTSAAAPATAALPQPRILLPFTDRSLPQRALDTALRIARTENATLVPVRLKRIPLHLPLGASPGHEVAEALTGIQRRAKDLGVRVDPRIGHGRSYRHALLRTLEMERYDRVVLDAGPGSGDGFTAADVAWLVGHADGEIVVVAAERPMRPRRSASYAA